MNDGTRILKAIEAGDPRAAEELLPLVYDELRRLAAARLHQLPAGQTLQPTALVHEAFLRLVGQDSTFDGRAHFFAAAAESMRRILIDRSRHRAAVRHGGGMQRRPLDECVIGAQGEEVDLIGLDDALKRLREQEPILAELVSLRYYAGLDLTEVAAVMKIARSTADRYWTYARAWLFREINGDA